MAYTAQQVINDAYFIAGIVARSLQVPSAGQISDGLTLLNDVLSFKFYDDRLIPYWTRGTFNTVVGQEAYPIANLVAIEYLTFNIGPLRYQMLELSRDKYFGNPRVDNIQSLPYTWHLERSMGESTIYMYFVPAAVYVMNYSGKFALTNVSLNTDMLLYYDSAYILYLKYALAEFLCERFLVTMPMQSAKKLVQLGKKLLDISPSDFRMQKLSAFSEYNRSGDGYQDVNLGKGWTV